jgi:leucyl aminopeptidase
MTLPNEAPAPSAIPLVPVTARGLAAYLDSQEGATRLWVEALGFRGDRGETCIVPGADGSPRSVLVGTTETPDLYALAHLPFALPHGEYALSRNLPGLDPTRAALGFALGSYQFRRYRKPKREPARLQLPPGADRAEIDRVMAAVTLVRDLVNTPTEDLGPAELGTTVARIGSERGARYREWVGDDLLTHNFPAIHAVGRASHRAPRLIELSWGDAAHPRLAIVGKGVCFDTGGLDMKTSDGMRWMKKDMGGAAHALALAQWVMDARLPVCLHLLIPAVENAIGPDAYRPGEVIRTRTGLTVEIQNTDAEGRVILGDALAYAAEGKPALILDFATLTGAARVALGPDLPAVFSNRDALSAALMSSAQTEQDPLWTLPLWPGYRSMLDSNIADLGNSGTSRHGGAITAALYLERFVPEALHWVHVDVYAWNDTERAGRPKGGEAQGLRAAFAFLKQRFG